jgi:hypothetical protein
MWNESEKKNCVKAADFTEKSNTVIFLRALNSGKEKLMTEAAYRVETVFHTDTL